MIGYICICFLASFNVNVSNDSLNPFLPFEVPLYQYTRCLVLHGHKTKSTKTPSTAGMAFTAARNTERKATLFFPMFVFSFIIVFVFWFGLDKKTLELELLMRWQEGRRRREQERTTLFQQSPNQFYFCNNPMISHSRRNILLPEICLLKSQL